MSKSTKNTIKTSPLQVSLNIANSKGKTNETRLENASKNKRLKTVVKAIKDGVVYLNEGVTSKQFNQAKRDTNRAVKIERSTISRCIADCKEQDKKFFSSLNMSNKALKQLLKPSELLEYATDSQIINYGNSYANNGYVAYNTWYTLGYIKAKLDGRDTNKNAIKFQELLKNDKALEIEAFVKELQKAKKLAESKKVTKK